MKKVFLGLLCLVLLVTLTACGGDKKEPGAAPADSGSDTIRIGYVNPTTGALAGNGEGCDWVVKQFTDYVREHPITVDGKNH